MEIRHVYVDFALMHQRPLRREEILHRVLNGEDMLGAGIVDAVYHRGERGGLALSHGSHAKEESLFSLGEYFKYRGQVELCECADAVRNKSESEGGRSLNAVSVHAEARVRLMGIRKVNRLLFLK